MAKKTTKKTAKKKVEILGATYEKGMPENMLTWRGKMKTREQMLKYLETGERYWYAEEGFGSEKRRKKA